VSTSDNQMNTETMMVMYYSRGKKASILFIFFYD